MPISTELDKPLIAKIWPGKRKNFLDDAIKAK